MLILDNKGHGDGSTIWNKCDFFIFNPFLIFTPSTNFNDLLPTLTILHLSSDFYYLVLCQVITFLLPCTLSGNYLPGEKGLEPLKIVLKTIILPIKLLSLFLRVGFEPTIELLQTDLQSAALNHSAISRFAEDGTWTHIF